MKANSHHLESMLSQQTKTHLAMSNTEHGKFGQNLNINPQQTQTTQQNTRSPSEEQLMA